MRVKSSFGLFILIFSVYWISDAITLYFFKDTNDIVVKFIIITLISFLIIAIYNFDNMRIEKKMQDILEKSNRQILNTTNKILSSQSMSIEKRVENVAELIKKEFELQEVFISIKKDNYLDIVNMTPFLDELLIDSRISLRVNRNPIKESIATEFLRRDDTPPFFKSIKREINGIYIHEILNIPIESKFSKENFGVITLLIPKNMENREEILSQLIVIAENIALNIFIDRQNSKRLKESANSYSNPTLTSFNEITSNIVKDEYQKRNDIIAISIEFKTISKKRGDNSDILEMEKKSIISLIRNLIRDIDITTLYGEKRLLLILPKDENSGASILINRLLEKLRELKVQITTEELGIVKYEVINKESRIKLISKLEELIND